MANANESFVVVSTTRADIAHDLNYRLEAIGCDVRLSDDDDRLTDAVCVAFALGKPVDWDNPNAGVISEENEVTALTTMGLV